MSFDFLCAGEWGHWSIHLIQWVCLIMLKRPLSTKLRHLDWGYVKWPELGIAAWGLVVFSPSKALCWPNQQKFGTLLTWPKVISPPKNLPNLSKDDQENVTFSLKLTNPHTAIPSSGNGGKMVRLEWPVQLYGNSAERRWLILQSINHASFCLFSQQKSKGS